MRRLVNVLKQGCPDGLCLLTRLCLVAVCALTVSIVISANGGCASSRAGLEREGRVLGVATNTAAGLDALVTAVPAPWQPLAAAGLGLVAAALAAWNTSHSRRVRALDPAAADPTVPQSPRAPPA